MWIGLIILIIIIYRAVKNSRNGKTKKVKEKIIIIPLVFLYLAIEQVKVVRINEVNILFILIALIIGALIGMFRSRFYEVLVNSDGEIVYKRQLFDILILIIYIIVKLTLGYGIGYFDRNLVNVISAGALFMAFASVTVRRVTIYNKYLKLKGKLNEKT